MSRKSAALLAAHREFAIVPYCKLDLRSIAPSGHPEKHFCQPPVSD